MAPPNCNAASHSRNKNAVGAAHKTTRPCGTCFSTTCECCANTGRVAPCCMQLAMRHMEAPHVSNSQSQQTHTTRMEMGNAHVRGMRARASAHHVPAHQLLQIWRLTHPINCHWPHLSHALTTALKLMTSGTSPRPLMQPSTESRCCYVLGLKA